MTVIIAAYHKSELPAITREQWNSAGGAVVQAINIVDGITMRAEQMRVAVEQELDKIPELCRDRVEA